MSMEEIRVPAKAAEPLYATKYKDRAEQIKAAFPDDNVPFSNDEELSTFFKKGEKELVKKYKTRFSQLTRTAGMPELYNYMIEVMAYMIDYHPDRVYRLNDENEMYIYTDLTPEELKYLACGNNVTDNWPSLRDELLVWSENENIKQWYSTGKGKGAYTPILRITPSFDNNNTSVRQIFSELFRYKDGLKRFYKAKREEYYNSEYQNILSSGRTTFLFDEDKKREEKERASQIAEDKIKELQAQVDNYLKQFPITQKEGQLTDAEKQEVIDIYKQLYSAFHISSDYEYAHYFRIEILRDLFLSLISADEENPTKKGKNYFRRTLGQYSEIKKARRVILGKECKTTAQQMDILWYYICKHRNSSKDITTLDFKQLIQDMYLKYIQEKNGSLYIRNMDRAKVEIMQDFENSITVFKWLATQRKIDLTAFIPIEACFKDAVTQEIEVELLRNSHELGKGEYKIELPKSGLTEFQRKIESLTQAVLEREREEKERKKNGKAAEK